MQIYILRNIKAHYAISDNRKDIDEEGPRCCGYKVLRAFQSFSTKVYSSRFQVPVGWPGAEIMSAGDKEEEGRFCAGCALLTGVWPCHGWRAALHKSATCRSVALAPSPNSGYWLSAWLCLQWCHLPFILPKSKVDFSHQLLQYKTKLRFYLFLLTRSWLPS